jgi:hypothetical protein
MRNRFEHPRPTSESGRAQPTSDQHEHVAELIRAVDVKAPARLHERVHELVAPRERTNRELIRSRLKPTLAAMVLAAALGAAIALISGGHTQAPTVGQASALTLHAATLPAPSQSGAHPAQLDVAVDGVPFPYLEDRFGWRASGARTDTIDGREITTVFYSGPTGARIGYAIVAGTPAPPVHGGTVVWTKGVAYRLLHENGAPVVAWLRDGRLCVLSGRGVEAAWLLAMASWDESSQAS